METTVGRVILNDHLPQDMPFINGLLKKKGLAQLVAVLLPQVWPGDHHVVDADGNAERAFA